MTTWTDWEMLRRQVVVAGWLVDATGRQHPAERVWICDGPRPVAGKTSSNKSSIGTLGRGSRCAHKRPAGPYFFLDLPAGRYTLRGRSPQGVETEQKEATVRWKKDGKAGLARVDLELCQ
jgi:hypothetical protein